MVIAYGRYSSDEMTFVVDELTLPPLETRDTTISVSGQQYEVFESQVFQNVERQRMSQQSGDPTTPESQQSMSSSSSSTYDSYSSTTSNFRQYRERMSKAETSELGANAFMVILSDVWLDKPQVLEKLKVLFEGFQDSPPACFVFMGNFMSRSFQFGIQQNDRELYRKNFDRLADVVKQFPVFLSGQTEFVFVPGSQDPGIGNVLPRPCIPDLFVRTLKDSIGHSHVHFVSNPVRIKFLSREIVLFREDMQHKMRRNCVLPPLDDTIPMHEHVVRSVVNNYHLSPLPLTISPVVWKQDHVLRLHPLPDALVMADKSGLFELPEEGRVRHEVEYEGYPRCINPSSFPIDYSFACYFPAENKVVWNKIPS